MRLRLQSAREWNWKLAVLEVMMIFIGITSAIWFDNLNEERREKKVETQTLQELVNAMESDLQDVKSNIKGFEDRVDSYKLLMNHFNLLLPHSDELEESMDQIRSTTTFISYLGPYETLKSQGFQIISDDVLRKKITALYDFEYEWIKSSEKRHHEHFNNILKPILIENFDLTNGNLSFVDYPTFIQDEKIKQAIMWALVIDSSMLGMYSNLEMHLEELIDDIQQIL